MLLSSYGGGGLEKGGILVEGVIQEGIRGQQMIKFARMKNPEKFTIAYNVLNEDDTEDFSSV